MKKLFFILLSINLCSISFLTAQNPFKKFGIEVGVITLSKGKYIEFIPYDSIQRIGSVVINIKTGHIIELVNTDSVELGFNYRPDVASRWMSPDPLAEEYWDWSPYNYCANNPIKFIDPNGEEIWIYYGTGKDDRYQYKDNQLYNTAGEVVDMSKIENSFVLSTFETLNGLLSSGADELGIINTLANDDNLTNIFETTWDGKNNYDGKVNWSPEGGIVTDDGGRQSPALGLLHELGESYVDKYDPLDKKRPNLATATQKEWEEYDKWQKNAGSYDNKGDEFIIKRIENPAIDALNKANPENKQSKRNNHHWTHKYKAVGGTFSTKGEELKKRKK